MSVNIGGSPSWLTKDGRHTGAGVVLWMLVACAAFSAAYASAPGDLGAITAPMVLIYLFGLAQLARAPRWRLAFYPGLGVGLLIAASQLTFFRILFSFGALALWLVFGLWIGLFTVSARAAVKRFGSAGWFALPFLWIGLEYFRSELYPLKFTWLSPGYAFAWTPGIGLHTLGVYGVGFALMAVAAGAAWLWWRARLASMICLGAATLSLIGVGQWTNRTSDGAGPPLADAGKFIRIAGAQMEFPAESEVLLRLSGLMKTHSDTELVVLSEYTFDGPVPAKVLNWCRSNKVHLVVGGKEELPGGRFYNTAFVISPTGEIVFKQVKSVPIQFMKDGLPAPRQQVWASPWGKLGICICYDLSYRRVTDELIRQGAQALLVPTMDVINWGRRQHELHARIAPTRAAEYGVPVFRLASSGISQGVGRQGWVTATAPFDGPGTVLAARLRLAPRGTLPADRILVPAGLAVTMFLGGWTVWGALCGLTSRLKRVKVCAEAHRTANSLLGMSRRPVNANKGPDIC